MIHLYRWDDTTPSHSFQVDRVDFTATLTTPAAGPTLSGSLECCSWELPADPGASGRRHRHSAPRSRTAWRSTSSVGSRRCASRRSASPDCTIRLLGEFPGGWIRPIGLGPSPVPECPRGGRCRPPLPVAPAGRPIRVSRPPLRAWRKAGNRLPVSPDRDNARPTDILRENPVDLEGPVRIDPRHGGVT